MVGGSATRSTPLSLDRSCLTRIGELATRSERLSLDKGLRGSNGTSGCGGTTEDNEVFAVGEKDWAPVRVSSAAVVAPDLPYVDASVVGVIVGSATRSTLDSSNRWISTDDNELATRSERWSFEW